MPEKSPITEEEFQFSQDAVYRLRAYYEARIVGQKQLEASLIAAIIADGHILLESVPGLLPVRIASAGISPSAGRPSWPQRAAKMPQR